MLGEEITGTGELIPLKRTINDSLPRVNRKFSGLEVNVHLILFLKEW